jgi:hypothetical protein
MSENIFDSMDSMVAPTTTAAAPVENSKKDKAERLKKAFRETAASDPTFLQRLNTLSDTLEVINSLGWGDSGNIVVDKEKTTKDSRALASTSVIVGYRVKNNGTNPIPYKTDVWTRGEDGKFVSQRIEKVLVPGSTADLNRQFMTMLCAQPEISFQLANGKVVRGSSSKQNKDDIKAELEAYYFTFDKDLGIQINSDEVKLNVGQKGADGKWTVKPEFAETFGYLENAPERAGRAKKESGPKYSAAALAANYVNKMMEDGQL